MASDDKASSKFGAYASGPGLPYADATQKIQEFLASAPPELRGWADARAEAVRNGSDSAVSLIIEGSAETPESTDTSGKASAGASPSASSVKTSAPQVSTPTMSKDESAAGQDRMSDADPCAALEELGESAEDMPCISVSTPSSRPARPHPSGKKTLSKGARILIAIVVVAALGFGIYWIGSPATPEAANPHGDMAGGMSAQEFQDSAARIKELESQVKDNPESVEDFLELGLLKFNIGDIQGAEEAWLKVTELDPNEIQAWYNLGFCYLAQDPADTARVREMWQHVIDIDPSSSLAQTVQSHMGALQQQRDMGTQDSEEESGKQGSTAPSSETNNQTN